MKKLTIFVFLALICLYAHAQILEHDFLTEANWSSLPDLESATPAATWANAPWSQNSNFNISDGNSGLYVSGDNIAIHNSTAPADADYYCEVYGRTGGTTGNDLFGPVVRHNGSTGAAMEAYWATIAGNDGTLRFIRRTSGGTNTELGNYPIPGFSAGTFYTVKLQVVANNGDADYEVWLDNTSRISGTDSSAITAIGDPGFRMYGGYGGGNGARIQTVLCDVAADEPGISIRIMRKRGR